MGDEQAGRGWRFMLVFDASTLFTALPMITESWSDAALYPLPSQAMLHLLLHAIWLLLGRAVGFLCS